MSLNALTWALNVQTGNGTNKLVLLLLADRYNDSDEIAWPPVAWLAERAELSRRTVQRALRELEEQGLIEHVGWRGRSADRQAKTYRLPIPNGASQCHPMTSTTSRGVIHDVTGRHSDALTIREPLVNRAPRKRTPVENRPAIRTPEETLAYLNGERSR